MFLSQKGYIQNTLNVYSWNNIDGQKTYFRGIFREAGGGDGHFSNLRAFGRFQNKIVL